MSTYPVLLRQFASRAYALCSILAFAPLALDAAEQAKAPTAKIYVVANEGGSQVASDGKIVAPAPKDSFPAQGAQLGTKPKGKLTIVFSNGTGAFLSPDTHIEVKRFTQEPFTASRTDLEREPSVSHTEIRVDQGIVAVSTSKLAAGSTLTLLTSLGSFNLRDGNLVITVDDKSAKFSLLTGEGTVFGGSLDLGGHVLHAGEQAVILPGPAGEPNIVRITKILADAATLEDLAAQAYAARKTVFFATNGDEITPVPVVPESIPVEAAVSPSKLPN